MSISNRLWMQVLTAKDEGREKGQLAFAFQVGPSKGLAWLWRLALTPRSLFRALFR